MAYGNWERRIERTDARRNANKEKRRKCHDREAQKASSQKLVAWLVSKGDRAMSSEDRYSSSLSSIASAAAAGSGGDVARDSPGLDVWTDVLPESQWRPPMFKEGKGFDEKDGGGDDGG